MPSSQQNYDMIIIGAGCSGPNVARQLCQQGMKVLMLEAGENLNRHTYPTKEIDANSRLYWGGGIELNTNAALGILRPKVVGGGTIVNQALVDRFDDLALDSWRETSGVSFFNQKEMAPWYDEVEESLTIQEIPEKYRNGNAQIFAQGFKACNHELAPLKRAQKDCRFEEGNDCIECLAGCRIDSKQSTPLTAIKAAQATGNFTLVSNFEVETVQSKSGVVYVDGRNNLGQVFRYRAQALTLAAGAIGNSKILLRSGFKEHLPALGENFYCHPQSMVLGLYEQEINAHKGPLQSFKSNDATFRANSFKLENVFAPPVAISMLVPGLGKAHADVMKKITHMACIEVAIRDTQPGRITINKKGRHFIHKTLNEQDQNTQDKGLRTIHKMFEATGAKKIINGDFAIGLHLMGGLNMGIDPRRSVVGPDFRVHGYSNIYSADSSIFPNAPGINPSLTIMALSRKAAHEMTRSLS